MNTEKEQVMDKINQIFDEEIAKAEQSGGCLVNKADARRYLLLELKKRIAEEV